MEGHETTQVSPVIDMVRSTHLLLGLLFRDAAQPGATLFGGEGVAGPASAAHLGDFGIAGASAAALVAAEALRTLLISPVTRERTLQFGPLCTPGTEDSGALLARRTGRALTVVADRHGARGASLWEADTLLTHRAVAPLAGGGTRGPTAPQRTEEALGARGGGLRSARPPTKTVAEEPSGAGLLFIHRELHTGGPLREWARGDTGAHCWPLAQGGQNPAGPCAVALQIRHAPAGHAEPSAPIEGEASQRGVAVFLARAEALEGWQPAELFLGQQRADLHRARGGQEHFTRGGEVPRRLEQKDQREGKQEP